MVVKGPGFSNGTIILEEPEAVYYSGQLLSGNVHFELNEPLTYSAINLTCLGEASVQRTEMQYEMSGGNNQYREVKYEGREQYFNFMQCVFGGTGISSMPPGVQSVPFQFQVPFNAPSSFKGEDGIILYCITAYLEYPEPGRREELVKEFQVVAPISPTMLASMKQPLELDFEEIETCNCFCDSKPIDMKIILPSRAFHVGSSIPIEVKVQNDSSVEIYEMYFKITMRHTYRTQRPRSEYSTPEEVLAEMKKGPILCDARTEYTWHLPLPIAVLPNLESCGIMDVAYFFKVKIQMTGCNEPIEDESEIFIGVLPESDTYAVTSPDFVPQLPKAPVPNPNNVSIGIIPAQNYPAETQVHQEYAPLIVPAPPESEQKGPYEIGFRTPAIQNQSPYPVSSIHSGYPPYPVMHPTAAGGSPFLTGRPSYDLNSSQSNIATAPSAPPM